MTTALNCIGKTQRLLISLGVLVSALPIPLDAGRLSTQELAPFSESRKSDEGYYDSAGELWKDAVENYMRAEATNQGVFQYLYPMSGIPIGVSPLVGKWVKKSTPEGGGKASMAKRDVDKTSRSEMRTVKFPLDPASFSRMEKRNPCFYNRHLACRY